MTKVSLLSNSEQTQYQDFIAAERGSFLQSWSWGEFQTSLGQKVLRFGLEDDNKLKLVGQFIEHTIPHLGGKYLYAPYGPIGDLSLLPQLVAEIKSQFPDYWFIRVEPQSNFPKVGQQTLRIQPGKTLVTDLSKTEDELLSGMHPKTRYNIKVATKHNVSISVLNSNDANLEDALNLISITGKRQAFTDHPKSYYQSLVEMFNNSDDKFQIKVYCAHYENKLLNSAVIVDYDGTRTYLFGGSSDEHKNVMAPYLLHWQALQDAKALNLKKYDWWGIETAAGKTPGFARFKLGWPGEQVAYPWPQDIISKPVHYTIYKLLRSVNRFF